MERKVSKGFDWDLVAEAMKEAAYIANHGTREERSGKFYIGELAKLQQPLPKLRGRASARRS